MTAVELALHPCARCAGSRRTCCQTAEIVLTAGDVGRIAAFSGHGDFHHRSRPSDPAYLEPDDEDPAWARGTFAPDGTRRVLRRRSDGDCTFLGAEGCVLPLEVRPLVCRLYPFAYTEHGLVGRDEDYCPTEWLAPGGEPMYEVLGVARSDAERWRTTLYEELRHGQP